ncbi:MAG: YidC/Oxa1 family membrane protein insertase [Firmicutes bacterium]|nr:YidC/Oxa1 family membrane protein insertase [Bacillota bacterium]
MGFIISATPSLNWIGRLIYNNLYLGWINNWAGGSTLIGGFAVTVIFFTLFLKIATLPLDLWQKSMGRKNQKKMEIMKPELDKLNKQYAQDKQTLMMKQRQVHKKYKYSAFGACLPAIVTMGIFIVVFTGFNSAVRFHNFKEYERLDEGYHTAYAVSYEESKNSAEATKDAEKWVKDNFKPEGFLLTTNIFMPDTWAKAIPTASDFSGSGIGKLGITVDRTRYEKVMKPLFEEYNSGGKWNGRLILPIFAFLLSIVSAKFVKPPEMPQMAGQSAEQQKASKAQQKFMGYLMPVMFGAFTLFYSSAFAIYMVMSNLFATVLGVSYNIITKKIDAREKDARLSNTIKR